MRNFGIPEPHRPTIDPSEFDDPFFGGEDKPPKPNVYMELGEIGKEKEETQEAPMLQHGELTPDEKAEILIDLVSRLMSDREIELTQQEASLVYQVDSDLPQTDESPKTDISHNDLADYVKALRGYRIDRWSDTMTDAEIRQLQDYEQVKSLVIERLRSEKYVIDISTALLQVAEGLGLDPAEYTQEIFVQTLIEKMKDWEERGIFDYLTTELIKNNNRHNIVPVPNKEFEVEKLFALAKKLADNKQYPKFHNQYYEQYNLSDLSGPIQDSSQPFRLILMPSKLKSEFEEQKLDRQRAVLDQLQASRPNLNFQVPALFETIAYWYVLRSLKYALDNLPADEIFVITSVRHFNLDVKPNGKWSAIPVSYLMDGYDPNLYYSNSEFTSIIGARISVR